MSRTPLERFRTDPYFTTLVNMFYGEYLRAENALTPTEVREAAGLAWQMYAERHTRPSMYIPRPEEGTT